LPRRDCHPKVYLRQGTFLFAWTLIGTDFISIFRVIVWCCPSVSIPFVEEIEIAALCFLFDQFSLKALGFLIGLKVIFSCLAAASIALGSLSALSSVFLLLLTLANSPRMPAGAVPFLSRGTSSGERRVSRMVWCPVEIVAMGVMTAERAAGSAAGGVGGATWTLTAFLLFITLMYPIIHSLSDLGEESTLELLCLP